MAENTSPNSNVRNTIHNCIFTLEGLALHVGLLFIKEKQLCYKPINDLTLITR